MLLDKVRETTSKYRLINKGDKIVIGVSGGPDSLTLLKVLFKLSKEFKLEIYIAHLDHMLRKDSYKDREFVERLAKDMRLAVISGKVDVMRLAQKGSIEEIARNARLDFLFRVANKTRADAIALGHNLDDQAETVLMRLLRGTGLHGLSAMLPEKIICGHRIIRPLIEVSRKEIASFLKKTKLVPRIDKTNLDDAYFRNKVRNRLLPLLEKEYNPNIKEILANTAQVIGCDYDYLMGIARQKSEKLGKRIVTEKLLRLHPAMQRMVLRLAIARIQGGMRRITFKHIKEVEDLIYNRPIHSIVNLPQGVYVVKKNKFIHFSQNKQRD